METINMGILAHVDAGKTTTAEQLLYLTGVVRNPGNIKSKNTYTDFLSIERERGISVKASGASIMYNGVRINLLDTPGHADFAGEVERSLYVLDAAVLVISAAEGVQAQTEIIWKALTSLNIPTIFFINKIDRAGCNVDSVKADIAKLFSPFILPLNMPVNAGGRECSETVSDVLCEEALLSLSEFDDAIAERYLNGEEISRTESRALITSLVRKRLVFPLITGAAANSVGIGTLLDAIYNYFPRVNDDSAVSDNPTGFVYKIEHDKQMGKIAHVRLYSGTLSNRDSVSVLRDGQDEPETDKITQIRRVNGAKYDDIGTMRAGEIAAVYGLSSARTGDFINEMRQRKNLKIAMPLFNVSLSADNDKLPDLLTAVKELSEEDPLLDYQWYQDEGELVVKVMGEIQVEALKYFLKERYNLDVTFMPPSVIYKETPLKTGIGFEAYTMPKPCWAIVKLEITPKPLGYGYSYESVVQDRDILGRYQNHIKTAVPRALKQGRLGWEVTDLHVKLIGGQHHFIHTHPMDFFLATPIAVMTGLVDATTGLLEPMLTVRMSADESLSGKIIGDIIGMRGEFDSPVMANGTVTVEATLPVASSVDYPIRFASLTSGKGTYKAEFAGYKPCPVELGQTARRRGVDPLDRAKWILHMRNAL